MRRKDLSARSNIRHMFSSLTHEVQWVDDEWAAPTCLPSWSEEEATLSAQSGQGDSLLAAQKERKQKKTDELREYASRKEQNWQLSEKGTSCNVTFGHRYSPCTPTPKLASGISHTQQATMPPTCRVKRQDNLLFRACCGFQPNFCPQGCRDKVQHKIKYMYS
jgi:hypothetical protein